MSCHAIYTTIAVTVLSLPVIGPPVQAQDKQSTQEPADLSARARRRPEAVNLRWTYITLV